MIERPGRGALLAKLDRRTLRPLTRPISTVNGFLWSYAFSPDRDQLALALGDGSPRIQFIDLRRWRSLGTLPLLAGRRAQ